jgi:hypothetical protein
VPLNRLFAMTLLPAVLAACATTEPQSTATSASHHRSGKDKEQKQLNFKLASGVYRCELGQSVEVQRSSQNVNRIELELAGQPPHPAAAGLKLRPAALRGPAERPAVDRPALEERLDGRQQWTASRQRVQARARPDHARLSLPRCARRVQPRCASPAAALRWPSRRLTRGLCQTPWRRGRRFQRGSGDGSDLLGGQS